jgi:hypothetical protein
MVFFKSCDLPSPQVQISKERDIKKIMEMTKAIKTGRKNWNNVKKTERKKLSKNFENNFMAPPAPLGPDHY